MDATLHVASHSATLPSSGTRTDPLPIVDPLIQYAAYYNYTVSPGNTYISNFFNENDDRDDLVQVGIAIGQKRGRAVSRYRIIVGSKRDTDLSGSVCVLICQRISGNVKGRIRIIISNKTTKLSLASQEIAGFRS